MIETKEKEGEVKELMTWLADSRVLTRYSRDVYMTLGATLFLVALILVFLKMFMLLAAVFSIIFLWYVMHTIPTEKVAHKVTTQGITTGGQSFVWEELKAFWFTTQRETAVLHIETRLRHPRELVIFLGKEIKKEEVTNALADYLSYRDAPSVSFIDKLASRLVGMTFSSKK